MKLKWLKLRPVPDTADSAGQHSSSSPEGARQFRSASAPFHLLAKPSGPICNLNCTYCFYLEKERLYPATTSWAMDDSVLESFVCQYIASQPTQTVSFAWQGGEPTILGVEYFERVVALQRKYAGGRVVENAFQTNGILLDDRWGAFLSRHSFLVGLSLDGPEALHDAYRRDRGGRPTFAGVMRGLEVLKRHRVDFNILSTVHRGNVARPLEVYRFLRDIGVEFIQFIPIVERVAPGAGDGETLAGPPGAEGVPASWTVPAAAYGEFLCAVFGEWVRRDVARIFVQQFDLALESWTGVEPSVCVFRETCGRALAVEHNGDVYSCDHFVYPEHRLGNLAVTPLTEMVDSPAQRRFGNAKRDDLAVECLECDVRFACHGDCPKHRFAPSRDGRRNLSYLCAAYKRFFRHINPYMRFMAGELEQGRAPANVMRWLADRVAARTGRNDPCPCGSPKKYKQCCGKDVNASSRPAMRTD